ncbi:MAG: type II secretion system protein GspG [Myxococcales bacterium]|nr:type II secretion system protein GspG [Myxococcales bacterium]
MKRRKARGLTLIEIVVVVTISALLMSAVAVSALTIHQNSLRERARMDVRTVLNVLDMYRMSKGRYPEPEKGLGALTAAKLVKEVPTDPWGKAYAYALEEGEPVVTSFGADGAPGGTGSDADVSSQALDED